MDAERATDFLLGLPHVVKTVQWGSNLVFWVADKAIGGKMFALVNLDGPDHHGRLGPVISFAAGAEGAAELREVEGMLPAPYLARVHWMAAARWDALRDREWQERLRAAHALVLEKLPRKTRAVLALPAKARRALIAERRKLLASRKDARQTPVQPVKKRTA